MKKLLFLSGSLVGIILALYACKHPMPEPPAGSGTGAGTPAGGAPPPAATSTCSPDTVYFTQQVLPILLSNCAMSGCHDAGSAQDGVVLTNYSSIMATGDVRPGNPNNSDIYEMITASDPRDRMPLGRPRLPQAQIDAIATWIRQGARNNSCVSAACDTASVTYSRSIQPIVATKCQGCHSNAIASGGVNFSSYAGVKAKVTDGRLWGAINHLPGFQPMPRGGARLTDCELAQFRIWIASGALNN